MVLREELKPRRAALGEEELVYPVITCPSLRPHLCPPLITLAGRNVGCAAIVTPKVRGQSDRLQEPLRRDNSPVQKNPNPHLYH